MSLQVPANDIANNMANTIAEYSSQTAEKIESIYWLADNRKNAILYANHEGFYVLRSLLDNAIMTSNTAAITNINLDKADKLLLMLPTKRTMLEVFLLDDGFVFNRQKYALKADVIAKLKSNNQYRVEKGDLISPKLFSIGKNAELSNVTKP